MDPAHITSRDSHALAEFWRQLRCGLDMHRFELAFAASDHRAYICQDCGIPRVEWDIELPDHLM